MNTILKSVSRNCFQEAKILGKQLEEAMNSVISGAGSRIPLLFLMIVHDLTNNASA